MPLSLAAKNIASRIVLIFVLVFGGKTLVLAMPSSYLTRTWQVEQGLPQNKVTAVVQTRDGYIWAGTYCGLVRFDGVRFTVFNDNNTPELPSSRVTSLFEADDGALWIGTESGDVAYYKNGRFVTVLLRPAWSVGEIYAISADNSGDVWLMNEAGELVRVRDNKLLSPPMGTVTNVISLARGLDGTVWVEREGVVSAIRNGRLMTNELPGSGYVQGFCTAHDGGFWVAINGVIRKWKNGGWVGDFGAAPWGGSIVPNMVETSSGALAGGTPGEGLWLVFPGQTNTPPRHFNRTNGLPSDWVISLCEDREKNLWCGTGAGLVLIRPNNVETVSPPDKWKGRPVLSVLPAPDGALWVGTEGAGLYRLQDGGWTNFDYAQGIRNSYVWSLAADANGKIWAGTWGGGLFRQQDDSFDFAPGLPGLLTPTPALLFLSEDLWIGSTAGALCYQNGKLARFDEIDGEPFGDVRAIAQDKMGTLWFGTAGSGLIQFQNGQFRRFKKKDGLSSDFIECLHFANDGSLWVGTFGSGLNRFKDGKFSTINQEQGLPNGVIGHIEEDGRGYFWLGSYGGILRANENELNRCADGEASNITCVTFGINDGLPTLECSEGMQSAGAKTPDGRLWFATVKGLVVVDPSEVQTNPLPPPVRIEAVIVDGKLIEIEDGGQKKEEATHMFSNLHDSPPALVIPPGQHRIEFEYTGLSFVAPEKVRFKCRLNNFETDWESADTKRAATYSYIPPGKYSFEVTACNNDGVWNKTGASLEFEILPFFWQTTWFHVAGGMATVLAAGALVWLDARRRLRRRLEKVEREHELERERARIAQDIHDDLGASLTRITMLTESARADARVPEPVTKNLNSIFSTARELTRAMDEIVWAVNPRHDTLDSLANYLSRFAYDYLSAAGIRCRLDVPLELPALPVAAETRHNLFLAFKEALHNVVQHAGASEVHVALALEINRLDVRVTDNGVGFAAVKPASSRAASDRIAHGNGLANMRRRLADIHGMCEIAGEPGRGTMVIFTVTLNSAQ